MVTMFWIQLQAAFACAVGTNPPSADPISGSVLVPKPLIGNLGWQGHEKNTWAQVTVWFVLGMLTAAPQLGVCTCIFHQCDPLRQVVKDSGNFSPRTPRLCMVGNNCLKDITSRGEYIAGLISACCVRSWDSNCCLSPVAFCKATSQASSKSLHTCFLTGCQWTSVSSESLNIPCITLVWMAFALNI